MNKNTQHLVYILKCLIPEMVPLILGGGGLLLGFSILVFNVNSTAVGNLATAAVSGAAGLSQMNRNERGDN